MNDDFEILDDRFAQAITGIVHLEMLADGCRWAEGPVWLGGVRCLLWSDIPNDRILKWDETDGRVTVFRQPSHNSNGHTLDRQGRIITCEHRTRRVSRTEHDGAITVIADSFEGRRLNSPNDVIVKSDGSIWFTDPTYGILSDYEGNKAPSEVGGSFVYRWDPDDGSLAVVVDDFQQPNGLGFSTDEKTLYIVDSAYSHDSSAPRHIRAFDVAPDGRSIGNGRLFAECTVHLFDGIRIDTEDRIWAGAGDGVHVFDPDGTLIGKVRVPEVVANLTFGGVKKNRLFMTGTTSLYAIYVNAKGAQTP